MYKKLTPQQYRVPVAALPPLLSTVVSIPIPPNGGALLEWSSTPKLLTLHHYIVPLSSTCEQKKQFVSMSSSVTLKTVAKFSLWASSVSVG